MEKYFLLRFRDETNEFQHYCFNINQFPTKDNVKQYYLDHFKQDNPKIHHPTIKSVNHEIDFKFCKKIIK